MKPLLDRMLPAAGQGKRRKIRKGTFSCWECKRRKKRCEFQSTSDLRCSSCHRLGAQCVGQELDEPLVQGDHETEKRLGDLEALVARLERRKQDHKLQQSQSGCKARPGQSRVKGLLGDPPVDSLARLHERPNGEVTTCNRPSALLRTSITASESSKQGMLRGFIVSMLPTPGIASAIIAQGQSPLAVLEKSASISREYGTEGHDHGTSHPLRLAQGLIHLALCLERLDFNQSKAIENCLEAPRSLVARQYVDAAHHVTCQDSLMDSFESLEILMLESSFEMSTGNVRSAWLSVRRALNIAQLLYSSGSPKQIGRREALTYLRLMLFDRVLSLMLGCSYESCISESWISKHITPTSLEHQHAEISGRIIARNMRMKERLNEDGGLNDGYDDYEQTRSIDRQLKSTTRTFKHLNYADIPTVKTDIAAHYVDQMHHYDLLVLTHLPYLLKGPHLQDSTTNQIEFDYSRFAGLLAAREVLSRVLICCKSPRIPNLSGGLSHKTYTSVVVLLLSHILGHAMGSENVLEHQRPGDLHIVTEIMEQMSRLSEAKRGIFDARVITELVTIEEDAANGHLYDARTTKRSQRAVQPLERLSNTRLQFDLPYLGIISIQPRSTQMILSSHLQDNTEDAGVELVPFDSSWNPQTSLFHDYGNEMWPLAEGMINGTGCLD